MIYASMDPTVGIIMGAAITAGFAAVAALYQTRVVGRRAASKDETAMLFAENRQMRAENAALASRLSEVEHEKMALEAKNARQDDRIARLEADVESLKNDASYWRRRYEEVVKR